MAKLIKLFILTAMVAGVTACTKKNQDGYGLPVSETLRINLTTEPPSLDWSKSTDTTSAKVQDNIMEGLTEFDYNDPNLKLLPALATEWKPSKNAQVWTFTVRSGVKWTDGVDFTAQHVLDGWERLLNPLTASEYAYFLYGIKGARAYNEGKTKDFSTVGAKLNDKGQIVVELTGPQSYFPMLLTHHSTFPVRNDVIKKHGDKWTEPGNIVTLGPYFLKKWDHDKAVVLERSPTYHGTPAKIKYVLGYIINEMSTAINLFDKGQLDIQIELPSVELASLRKRPEFRQFGILSLYYYGFNAKKPPMDNIKVRQAIAHAIDRQEVTKLIGGGQLPLTSWVPAGMFGHEPSVGLNHNPDKANKLLDDAGYKDRSKFPKISLSFNTNENHQRIAENVQSQLKKKLGINVELQNEEWKVYLSTLKVDPAHMYRMGWLADFPDPDNFLNLMTSYSDNNHTNWGNKKFDNYIETAAATLDTSKRRQLYNNAQKILLEKDTAATPIMSSVRHNLISKRVKNFPMNSMERYPFKNIELVK